MSWRRTAPSAARGYELCAFACLNRRPARSPVRALDRRARGGTRGVSRTTASGCSRSSATASPRACATGRTALHLPPRHDGRSAAGPLDRPQAPGRCRAHRGALGRAVARGDRADWAHFSDWCRAQRWPALPAPPEAVAAYLATLATTHTRGTIRRGLVAIGQAHRPCPDGTSSPGWSLRCAARNNRGCLNFCEGNHEPHSSLMPVCRLRCPLRLCAYLKRQRAGTRSRQRRGR